MTTRAEPVQVGQPGEQPIAGLVEHLRTVHFSLLAVSFALIGVCATRSEGQLKTAHRQLQQIIETARSWDEKFINQQVLRILAQKDPELLKDAKSFEWPDKAIEISTYSKFRLRRPEVNWTVIDSRGYPLPKFSSDEESYRDHFFTPEPYDGFEQPETIADFAAYWNWLRTTNIYVPTELGDEVFEEQGGSFKSVQLRFGSAWFGDPLRTELVALARTERNRMPGAKVWSGASEAHGYLVPGEHLLIPVATKVINLDGQDPLIERYRDWRRGEFSYSFRQLERVSEAYKAAPLGMAEQILQAEVERSGSPLEAFGTKIPAELVTLWGPIIVFAVQVYFCLHLSQLRRQGFSMQEGDSIAWIALYTSGWARLITYFSAVFLPLLAIIRAIYRAHDERVLDWWEWTLRVFVLLCSVSCSGITARIIYQLDGSRGGPEGRQVQTGSTNAPQSEI